MIAYEKVLFDTRLDLMVVTDNDNILLVENRPAVYGAGTHFAKMAAGRDFPGKNIYLDWKSHAG